MKKYLIVLALLTPLICLGVAPSKLGQATQTPIVYLYEGKNYVVPVNNSGIIRIEPAPAEAFVPCSEQTPCLYDDLPFGTEPYVNTGGRWPAAGFTYSIGNTSGDIFASWERGIIAQAFGIWANVAKVQTAEVADGGPGSCTGDVRLWWATGEHGDGYPFDGPGGVLAHCFYPPPINSGCIAGDIHFDDAETWVSPTIGGAGIDLATVAAHEMGHALGLGHSADPNALMYAYYTSRRPYLSYDDIAGVVAIYGTQDHDIVFQIEELNTIAPGAGSIRLREDSIKLEFRKKGTSTYLTRYMPRANVDAGGSYHDVDGVLSKDTFSSQFDGYLWHKGDLYRTLFTLSSTYKDVDLVRVTFTITNNVLSEPLQLRASLNGKILGDIQIAPGNATVTATFPVHFVNPFLKAKDLGSHLYGDVLH